MMFTVKRFLMALCFMVFLLPGFAQAQPTDFLGIASGPYSRNDTTAFEFLVIGASKTVTSDAIDITDCKEVTIQVYESNSAYRSRVWAAGEPQTIAENDYTEKILTLQGVPLVSSKNLGSCTKTYWLEAKAGIRSATYGSADNIIHFSTIPIFTRAAAAGTGYATGAWIQTNSVATYQNVKADVSGFSQVRFRCSGNTITGVTQVVVISKKK